MAASQRLAQSAINNICPVAEHRGSPTGLGACRVLGAPLENAAARCGATDTCPDGLALLVFLGDHQTHPATFVADGRRALALCGPECEQARRRADAFYFRDPGR